MNATTILLEPLGPEDSAKLIANLVDDASLANTVQQRIGETAEGNPLFVEELVAMLVDQGVLKRQNGGWLAASDLQTISVPPSISALVAARLDHLEPNERDLIGRASVVGKIFQRSAVTELSPPDSRGDLGSRLMTLVRKELVRPDRSSTTGDEAFRFRHLLVRDAAYASLTKEQRADLHARFADWLERIAGDRLLEYEEVMAYHLEQACSYRSELGLTDELTTSLRARAAAHLRSAGIRAYARSDLPAARNLLTRALPLVDEDRERAELLLHIGSSCLEMGDFAQATESFGAAKTAAVSAGDEELALRSELTALDMATINDPSVDMGRILALADELETLATRVGRKRGRIVAEHARASAFLNACRWMDSLAALERARQIMQRDDDPRLWIYTHMMLWNSLRHGPVPAPEAMSRIKQEAARIREESDSWGNDGKGMLAALYAMQGDFATARDLYADMRGYLMDRGMTMLVGAVTLTGGAIEYLAGDWEATHRTSATGIETLQRIGETGVLSTLASMDADALYRLGRRAEMEEAIQLARESGAPHDLATQMQWRWVAAMAAADDGNLDEAQRLIGEAVAMAEPTDFPEYRAGVFEALAHVEARAGRADGWRSALDRALAEHERKANLPAAQRVRDAIANGPPGAVTPSTST